MKELFWIEEKLISLFNVAACRELYPTRMFSRKIFVMLLLTTNMVFSWAFASKPSPDQIEANRKYLEEMEKKRSDSEPWRLALVEAVQPKFVKIDSVANALLALLNHPEEDMGGNDFFFNGWRDLEVISRSIGGEQIVDRFVEELVSEVKNIPQKERRKRIYRMVEKAVKEFIATSIFYCTYKNHDPERHKGQALVDRAKEYSRSWSRLEAASKSVNISPMVLAGGISRMANTGNLQPAIVQGMVYGLNTARSYLEWGRALIRLAVRAKKVGKSPDKIWDEMASAAIGNTIQDLDNLDVSNVPLARW